jgi:hypothetical protein
MNLAILLQIRDFILWWYGMQPQPQKPPIEMLADQTPLGLAVFAT